MTTLAQEPGVDKAGPTERYPSSPVEVSAIRTVRTVAERELLEQLTSLRFLVILVLVVLLTPLTVYVGNHDYLARVQSHQRLMASKSATESLMRKSLWGLYDLDSSFTPYNDLEPFRALRPPNRFSTLIRGLDGAMPEYWEFSGNGVESGPAASPAFWMADVLGALDVEFVIRVVLGLLAILIAFDAIVGEKELGTLRLALSHPVSRPVFWIGKMLGGAFSLIVPLAIVLLLAVLSTQMMGVRLVDKQAAAMIGTLFLVSSGYLLALFALGLLASSVAKTHKTSLVVLLVFWVVLVLAAPPLAVLIARAIEPVPSVHLVEAQKRALAEDLQRDKELALGTLFTDSKGNLDLGAYRNNREMFDQKMAPIEAEFREKKRRLTADIDRSFERAEKRQRAVASTIMMLSPAALFAQAATGLVGTGDSTRQDWTDRVRRRQIDLEEIVFRKTGRLAARNERGSASMTFGEGARANLSEVPAFAIPEEDWTITANRILLPTALLFLFCGVFVFAGLAAFHRYDVR